MPTEEGVASFQRSADEATSAVLDARNSGLAYLGERGPLGEAAEKVERLYWQMEDVRALIRLHARKSD